MAEGRATLSTNIPPAMGRRARAAVRNAAVAAADWHWKKSIPLHFKSGNATRYGYKPRSKRYQAIKRLLTRRGTPLVFSGTTQQEVTGSRTIRATGTKGSTLLLRASFAGMSGRFRLKAGQRFLSQKQEMQLARVKEIEAIRSDEIDELVQVEERQYSLDMAIKGPIRRLT